MNQGYLPAGTARDFEGLALPPAEDNPDETGRSLSVVADKLLTISTKTKIGQRN